MSSSSYDDLLNLVEGNAELTERIKSLRYGLEAEDLLQHFRFNAVISQDCTTHTEYERDESHAIRIVKRRWYRRPDALGWGVYGKVWLERDDDDGQSRAVKVIPKDLMERDKINYKREVLALAKFSKRQYQQQEVLVNFLGWLDDPSNLYLYMEYFPLGDLEGHISQPISEEEVKDIAMNLLNGLCIIHAEHFAHRDLKPGNIFVVRKPPTARWWVKIGDFGIAKRVNHERTALQTSIGTPQYLAPEVSGDLDLDEPTSVYNNAVDIWSLGCVIYRIATQHNPFPARTDLRRFCSGRKPFPEEPLRNTMEPDGVKFVKALISPFPNERPSAQAASEMAWLQGDFSTVTQEVARARSDGKSTPNRRLYGTRQAQRPARVVNLSSDNSHVQEDRGNAHNQGPQQDAPQNSFNSNPRDNPTIEDAIRNMIRPELEKLRREGYPRHFFRRGNVQPGFPVPVATPYVSDSGKRP